MKGDLESFIQFFDHAINPSYHDLSLTSPLFIGQLHRLHRRGRGRVRGRGEEDARGEDEAAGAGDAGAVREGPRGGRRRLQAAAKGRLKEYSFVRCKKKRLM